MWPRSFRGSVVAAVADVTRGRGDDAICFTILSFCGRGWWAGVAGRTRASAPRSAAKVLRLVCDECHLCPMVRAGLKRCAGCRAVYYCTRVDAGGRAACQLEAWGEHKAACKAAVRARKKLEAA